MHFSVDSHLLLELGERLVARKSVALAELIKNAYDADATAVTVTFKGIREQGGTIMVKDNGEGMTLETFQKGWMLVATDMKMSSPVSSKYGRPKTGSKGVGRFACRVLSDKIVLETVAKAGRGKVRTRATFDWQRFSPGSMIDSISVPVVSEEVGVDVETGTSLRLENVREAWSESDIRQVRADIVDLVSPFPVERRDITPKADPGFEIRFDAPEFEAESGPVSETILKAAWAELSGSVDDGGRPSYRLEIRHPKKTLRYTPPGEFSAIGACEFRIRMMSYQKEVMGDTGVSIGEARKFGLERGGVRMYLDNFRVFSYGEPGDDWLNLDSSRARRVVGFQELKDYEENVERPMLLLPGNNQLFGAVHLSRMRNKNLQLTVTRERLVENKAFIDLKRFVRLGIEWMTVQYARQLAKRKDKSRPDPLVPLATARDKIRDRSQVLGPQATEEILQLLDTARDSFRQREESHISEISMLRVLATTGTMILLFEHELSAMIAELKDTERQMSQEVVFLPAGRRTVFQQSVEKMGEWIRTVEEYGLQLGVLMGSESRLRLRAYPLRPILDDLAKPFQKYMSDYQMVFVNDLPPTLRSPPMYLCEISSIFLNLLTNSMKAVRKSPFRQISVRGQETKDGTQIFFLDTGKGVPDERREEVFEPFNSTSEPDPILGQGTGLGLKMTRDVVETYGGTIHFIDPPEGWGACVEILFPKE
jgi:signal transduction histidine kinase